MAVSIVTSRTRALGSRAPTGPFTLNKDSPQAQALQVWFGPSSAGGVGSYPEQFGPWRLTPNTTDNTLRSANERGVVYQKVATASTLPHTWVTNTLSQSNLSQAGWTLSCWFNSDRFANGSHVVNVSVPGQNGLGMEVRGGSSLRAHVGGSNTTGGDTVLNQWYHGAVIWQPSGDFYSVLNGQIVAGPGNTASLATGAWQLRIFTGLDGSGGTNFQGRAYDIRAYDRALSLDEINQNIDPATRYDLWWQPRRTFFFLSAVGPIDRLLDADADIAFTTTADLFVEAPTEKLLAADSAIDVTSDADLDKVSTGFLVADSDIEFTSDTALNRRLPATADSDIEFTTDTDLTSVPAGVVLFDADADIEFTADGVINRAFGAFADADIEFTTSASLVLDPKLEVAADIEFTTDASIVTIGDQPLEAGSVIQFTASAALISSADGWVEQPPAGGNWVEQ